MGDENNSCFPGQERLAKMAGTSVSTVRRTLKDFESWGLITRERRQRSDGYRSSDRYFLHLDKTLPVNLTGKNLTGQIGTLPVKSGTSYRSLDERAELLEESLEEESLGEISTEKPKIKRATRVPDDFVVSAELRDWAGTYAPSVTVDDETESFKDYWRGIPGARGLKTDWVGAWRNWMRKSHSWAVASGWKAPEKLHRFGSGSGSDVA
jgi:hypothetical protein